MIDRAQPAAPELLGQLVRIHLVAFVPVPRLSPLIAHHDPIDQGAHQLVQPLGLGPLLPGHMHGAAHPAEELDDRRPLRG
jgi:hypothetical protein